ncbi:hypothetical protein EOM75_02920 [Candidatus Falkowbacteria bacterium]|nr:hypothetical protein [Candidatus Falkowbacteria bacterium]
MKLKKFIQSNAWLSVEEILLQLYPDEEKNISGYKKVFEELLFMHPEDSEISIVVAHQKDDYDGEEYVNVSGKYANPKSEEEEFSQAIEFTSWNKWLGMEISQESLQHFSELEIISHCLYEMTFVGFEEEEIQKELNSLEKSIEEYKNMTDEEKKANTISLEELLKDLENDESEEN